MAELIRESDPDGAVKLSRFAREGRYLADKLLSYAHGSKRTVLPSPREVRDWEATALPIRREVNQIDPDFCRENRLVRNRVTGKGVVPSTMRPDELPAAPKFILSAPLAPRNGREDGRVLDTGSRRESGTREYEWLVELAAKGLRERDNHPMPESVTTPAAFYEVMAGAALDAIGLPALLEEVARAEQQMKITDEAPTQRANERADAVTTLPDERPVSPQVVLSAPLAPCNGPEDVHGFFDPGSRPERGPREYESLMESPPKERPDRDSHPVPESVMAPEAFSEDMTRAALDDIRFPALLEDVAQAERQLKIIDDAPTQWADEKTDAATTLSAEPPVSPQLVLRAPLAPRSDREDGHGVPATGSRRERKPRKAKNARLRR